MKNFLFSNVEHFRYERKFYIEGLRRQEVESILKTHPAIFREIYCERSVNNIYFDSFDLQHYFSNIDGTDRRLKVRIRWYGDLFGFIERPALELKLKQNMLVGKFLYPIKSFTLDNSFSIDIMRRVFKESSLNEILKLHLRELNFSLLNVYNRKYFLSSDRKHRATVDSDMKMYELSSYQNNFLYSSTDYTSTILEVKYNKPQDKYIDELTNYFPFRLTKSSKYIHGIVKLAL